MALHASDTGMRPGRLAFFLGLVSIVLAYAALAAAQVPRATGIRGSEAGGPEEFSNSEAELQQGIALTRQSHFPEAIPHFLAARGRVRQEFAVEFNLALCYVATGQYKTAIEILTVLRSSNSGNAGVYNLLAQAYIGNERLPDAVEAVRKAAAITPNDEKLYLLVADACMERQQYSVGLDVANLGLRHLPNSAPLLYQRAMFLTLLDQFDAGRGDFDQVVKLADGTGIAYLAEAQKATFEGDIPEVIRAAREGIKQGYGTPALLTILGEALLRSGVAPGQPEFAEAVTTLEKAIAQGPASPVSRVALGKLYLLDDRADAARTQLEAARELDPLNPAVYSNLAKAYRRLGDSAKAQEALTVLAKLNESQAEKIRSSPGERKASYLGSRPSSSKPDN